MISVASSTSFIFGVSGGMIFSPRAIETRKRVAPRQKRVVECSVRLRVLVKEDALLNFMAMQV